MSERSSEAIPSPSNDAIGGGAIPPTSFDVIEKSKPRIDSIADDKTEEEQESIEEQRSRLENVGLEQDIKERRKYAHRNFCLISAWLFIINVMLFFQGFKVTVYAHPF